MKKNLQPLLHLRDEELISLFQNGNGDAFDVLIERHNDKLKFFSGHLMKNKFIVDDVMQDVWLAVFLKLQHGGYTEENNFTGWLRTITHHTAMNDVRTEMKYVHNESKLDLLCVSPKEKSNHRKILYWALSHLSPHMKRIIMLHFFRGKSFKEIALQFGVTVGAVTSAYSKALKKLRAEMQPQWSV